MKNIIEITNFSAKELDIYARYSENQLRHIYEPETGIFIAESPKVITRAYDAGYEPLSFLADKRHLANDETKALIAKCSEIPIYTANSQVLTKLTGFQLVRGVLCAMRRRELPKVKNICANSFRIAILENVVNPTNVGAIFRSAAALHMDAVLLTKGCSDPLYRRAARVSMGTVFQIPWTYLHGEISEICQLRQLGFRTAAMALNDSAINISDPRLLKEEKLAIILGTEGEGLSAKTISESDYVIKIPMSHNVDSLNVAAASAVAFWQLGKHIS